MQSDIDNKPSGAWKHRWRGLPVVGVISDLESARRAGKVAATFPFVCAVLILIGANSPLPLWAIFYAALFAGLGFGIWRMSRACAVSVLPLYIINIALNYVGTFGKSLLESPIARILSTLVFGLIAGTFFVQGVRGTFAYQSLIRGHIQSKTSVNGPRSG
jgi:hypothetical protein